MKKINLPLEKKEINKLKAGEEVFLNGIIYTARDQAHKRLVSALGKGIGGDRGKEMPFDIRGAVIYYCGPAKTPKGKIIGSCGPTTSSRMDAFTPILLKCGLSGMIGKGKRSLEVRQAIRKYKGVYFLTFAGCGALLNKYIKKAGIAAYADLGPEAVYKLEVEDFPLIVGIDSKGNSVY
ncbi:MAG: FumA C-terminus/TtdB family hydratase beta subunit [Candidatus Omnitrophota bacterium]|nr:FumA C-terminus/TtdB family hydratase beta subunit [Candidatus Omnitrophota bacterium]MBU1928566.1 FumA C-terminus/TtdB family hydratase beta subunit [Candidatus Omnitrophota bacterium]MBU2034579.1 FumA C-terminus/TtdB family hydratase beta subunit [Candidatus Omnitrophota bacterium]MBU2220994.1 FumA C-terminus/TtdB family hydratase beta subunit [Candidatus Omnitrophota bacterium]